MLCFRMPTTPSLLQAVLVFAAGAVVVTALAALVRSGLAAALEPAGQRLDRWRRVWFHPERELGLLLGAFLVLSFVVVYGELYRLPGWVTAVLFGLGALRLPGDLWSWFRTRSNPRGTRQLHERGFLLLDLGPLWLRGAVALAAAGLYFLLLPLRTVLDTLMAWLLTGLAGWFS